MHRPIAVYDQEMNTQIGGYFKNASSKGEVLFTFAEGYCHGMRKSRWHENMDVRVPAHQTGNACNIGALIAMNSCKDKWAIKVALVDNPMFMLNGHCGSKSPNTSKHIINQIYEKTGSKIAGYVVPAQLAVAGKADAAGAATARLRALQNIARKSRSTGTIAEWLSVVIHMSKRGRNVRTVQLAGKIFGCFVPYGGMLSTPIVSYLQSGKANLEFACVATALELHWRAFVEQRIGGQGPATRILHELFKIRGSKRLVTNSEIDAFVHEPAGWLPIKDALLAV